MSRLPFVVQPRLKPKTEKIGSEEAGYIEIERRGYLTAGEMAFSQANGAAEAGVSEILGLARKIATKYGVDLKAAYQLAVNALGQEADDANSEYPVMADFGVELGDVMSNLMRQEHVKKHIKALCLLIYRVDDEISGNDVSELHPDLVDALAELFDDEEARSVEKLADVMGQSDAVEEASDTEDIEKK